MRKLLFILLLLFSGLMSAKVDIYYGNGIWAFREFSTDNCDQDKAAADCGRKALEDKLQIAGILNDPFIATNDAGNKATLQYNVGRGYLDDILETFFQIRESGQLDDVWFFTLECLMS